MTENTLKFFAILAMIAVLVVLIRGLKTFFTGGNLDSKRKSNKLMQMRIAVLFTAPLNALDQGIILNREIVNKFAYIQHMNSGHLFWLKLYVPFFKLCTDNCIQILGH